MLFAKLGPKRIGEKEAAVACLLASLILGDAEKRRSSGEDGVASIHQGVGWSDKL